MKITNRTVGFLLFTLFIVTPFVIIYFHPELLKDESYNLLIGAWVVISGFIVVIILVLTIYYLIADEVEFAFTIPTPFSAIKSYYKAKKNREERKSRLYDQLYKAKTEEEIDLINRKLDKL